MDLEIALSPDLNVAPEAFVTAWNDDAECRELAEAKTRQKDATQFEPVTLAAFLATVAGGVAASVISHLIIKALGKNSEGQANVEVKEVTHTDGTRMFVVTARSS